MADQSERRRITARFTIEGHAESLVADIQRLRYGGTRVVLLTVQLPMVGLPNFSEDYTLPQIRNGNTADAFETLARLARQGRVDSDTEQRLGELIEAFGRLTE